MNPECSFSCEPRSLSDARRYIRNELAGEDSDLVEAATLLVSELAANVLQHAHSAFVVRVTPGADEIRFEVADTGVGEPGVLELNPRAPSGRGLQIVQGLSREWGVVPLRAGKVVWFTLPRPSCTRG